MKFYDTHFLFYKELSSMPNSRTSCLWTPCDRAVHFDHREKRAVKELKVNG